MAAGVAGTNGACVAGAGAAAAGLAAGGLGMYSGPGWPQPARAAPKAAVAAMSAKEGFTIRITV
jgi:hypothetical protein